MINRTLIRIKVVQMVYSYVLTKDDTNLKDALKQLAKSFDKSYELYNYLLLLIVELTDLQDRRLDDAKNKYLPTEEDLNPNTRFVDNRLVAMLREDKMLNDYVSENKITWKNDDVFMKLLLDKILHSEVYEKYMSDNEDSLAHDCELWKQLFKQVILTDDDFAQLLENKSVYWNDDLEIMGTFAIKTIRRFEEGEEEPILPMYKDSDDEEFGKQLFLKSVASKEENDSLIDGFVTDKWDVERVAFMDRIVMDVCITEVKEFLSIPTSVSLNEYIEIAKCYSTPKSGVFVNGILNAVVRDLKAKKVIVKD